MNAVILFAFITVAGAGRYAESAFRQEWQNLGVFSSMETCKEAIKQLGQPEKMRCINR